MLWYPRLCFFNSLEKLKGFMKSVGTRMKSCFGRMKLIKDPLDPLGAIRVSWDILILLLIVYDLIILPIKIAFDDQLKEQNDPPFFSQLDKVQTAFFFIDIGVSFHTSYYKAGTLVKSHKRIAKRYLKGWFWLDLVTAFPFFWIENYLDDNQDQLEISSTTFRLLRLIRIFKLIRVIRVVKLKKIFNKIHDSYLLFSPTFEGILQLLSLSLKILFIAHWVACFWCLLGQANTEETWLKKKDLQNGEITEIYVASLYFCITTFMTVGYGDITPSNTTERVFGIIMLIIGCGLFGYSLDRISTIVNAIDMETSKTKRKIYAISRFIQKQNLEKDIQDRVKTYLDFLLANEDGFQPGEHESVLSILSDNLRQDVQRAINGKILRQHSTFQKLFTPKLIHNVSIKLQEKIVAPGETLYEENEFSTLLCMIAKGSIELVFENIGKTLVTLHKGAYFGEVELITGRPSKLLARSVGFSKILSIKREDFIQVLENFSADKVFQAEMFHMIKNKITLYSDYSDLNLRCDVCKEANHPPLECPKVNYIPDKQKVIQDYLEEWSNFRKNFTRNNRRRFDAKRDLLEIKGRAETFRTCHPNLLKIKDHSDLDISALENISNESDDSARIKPLTELKNSFDRYNSLKREHIIQYTTDELVFDQIKNFQIYFPHNNFNKILQSMTEKSKPGIIKNKLEAQHLMKRLGSFFGSQRRSSGSEPRTPRTPKQNTESSFVDQQIRKRVSSSDRYPLSREKDGPTDNTLQPSTPLESIRNKSELVKKSRFASSGPDDNMFSNSLVNSKDHKKKRSSFM